MKLNLQKLQDLSETVQMEFKLAHGKENKGELPKDFWKSYSAMANAHGGLIVLGIKEKSGKFDVVGVPDIEKVKHDLFNLVNNREHVSVNLLTNPDVVYSQKIKDKEVLIIQIPQATRKQKPVHLTKNPLGNTYIRLHDGDRLCDDESVKRMLAEQLNDSRDDGIVDGAYSFERDIDHNTLNAYRNRLSAHKPSHPFLDLSLFDFFKKIGGWRIDHKTNREGMTVAGILMFGHFDTITSIFPHYFVDYQEPSDDRWSERIFPDGTWSGNLFDFYRKVYQRLVADLKVPFALNGDQRIDDTPTHQALREALVNTLVHADYSEHTPILVKKSADQFEFRNPGNLRLSKDEIWQGGVHDCRNSLLHQMFLLIGLGERAGSGIPKILKGCQIANWSEPVLREKLESPQQTFLTLSTVSLIADDVKNTLKLLYPNDFHKFDYLESLILATAISEMGVTHKRCCELTSQHERDITLILQKLKRKGFLTSNGTARQKVYSIPDELYVDKAGPSRDQVGTKSGPSWDQVGTKSGPSQNLVAKLENGDKVDVHLTVEQRYLLDNMNGSMSIRELLELSGRSNRTKFREQILAPLLKIGLIEMTIPDKPTSSKQRYKLKMIRE
ncbi:RNA-binding domain-containing protein [[Pasteurella] aerogenes]